MNDITATAIINRIKQKALLNNTNIGVAAPDVTKHFEYGDGFNHTTILTIDAAAAFTSGDNVSLADGKLIYTFPAGAIMVNSAYLKLLFTNAEHDTEDMDVGLGTAIGTGAVAVLGGNALFENVLFGQTIVVGTETAIQSKGDVTGGLGGLNIPAAGGVAHILHLNLAGAWADTAGAALDVDVAGTVILNWSFFE